MTYWTEKRRKEYRDRINEIKPWEKSTGARTPEGKAITSQNPKKHFTEKKTFITELLSEVRRLSRLSSERLSVLDEMNVPNPDWDALMTRLEALEKDISKLPS